MNYPLISEYIESIKNAEENFEQLKHLRPVLGGNGEPVFSSGNFAVVFKMKDEKTGKLHAVKCFLKEQEGRAEAYRLIAEELEFVSSTFLTPIKYMDKELFVDSSNSEDSEFPVLLMDWVEGQTLDSYLRYLIWRYQKAESEENAGECLGYMYEMDMLAYQFSRLAMWLMPQPFAHGDLKPDNILVRKDGTLALVDYDGMYVPAMKGQRARELGSPDFRHPSRTEDVFDEHIDDFSLVSILLSLKAIALQPELLEQYGASDRLLFSANDYRNLSESQVMDAIKTMMQDPELATLYSLFILSSAQNNLSQASFRLLNLNRPQTPVLESRIKNVSDNVLDDFISTSITYEDLDEYECVRGVTDENGGIYSPDGKRLLEVDNDSIFSYQIRKGTVAICDWAFTRCRSLKTITIPSSVIKIGINPFAHTEIEKIICQSDLFVVENNAFFNKDKNILISYFGNDVQYAIPESVNKICDSAFESRKYLESVIIPDTVTDIGRYAFSRCTSLKIVNLPVFLFEIADFLFEECCSLKSVHLPENLKSIGEGAFNRCESLRSITLPKSVDTIAPAAFDECKSLASIYFLKIAVINEDIMWGCDKLTSVVVPKGTKNDFLRLLPDYKDKIEEKNVVGNPYTIVSKVDLENSWVDNFGAKYSLDKKILLKLPLSLDVNEYTIKEGTTIIGNEAFANNFSLWKLTFPNTVTHIGWRVFYGCSNLTEVTLPSSIVYTDPQAFLGCLQLNKISIPVGTRNKFETLLPDYKDKLVEIDNRWRIKNTRGFTADEIAAVDLAKVVPSQYGLSVQFDMVSGGQTYIPLSPQSNLIVDDVVDLTTAKLITLSRAGDDDIYRVME